MKKKISGRSATFIVIANMIGTGVFTSLGFQIVEIQNTLSIIILWSLGAIMAISGAFSYAELGTKLKRSGGEYHFLSQVYNKSIGYLSGWTSLTVGFSAPIALAAMAAGAYTQKYLHIDKKLIAISLIILISLLHTIDLKRSSQFQNITTSLKIFVVLLFVFIGVISPSNVSAFDWGISWQNEIFLPAYAISLVYVSYSYSGWNAAAYISDEIRNIKRNLPFALIGGSLFVSLCYILLQLVFLKHASIPMLSGKLEIGQIVAENLFGEFGGKLISSLIGLLLISSISAMVWVGPRVSQVMAEDHILWSFLKKTNRNNIPNRAILFQASISIFMVLSGTFEQVITYSGFILQVFVSLTVLSLFFVKKNKNLTGFKSPLFPIPQIIFLIISLWIIVYLLISQTYESFIGIFILVLGFISYKINQFIGKKKRKLRLEESASI